MLQPPISFVLNDDAEGASAVIEFAAELDRVSMPSDDDTPFQLLKGPWFPMFGDSPHYEPAV